jgi:hypothetical protein
VTDPLAQLLAASRARIDRFKPAEVPAALASGAVLIDIRTEGEGWAAAGMPVEAYDPERHALQGSDRASIRDD